MIADTPFLLQSPGPGGGVCNRAGFYAKTFRSPVGVFAWGVFAWVFLRIDRVFLRISDRLNGVEKSNVGMPTLLKISILPYLFKVAVVSLERVLFFYDFRFSVVSVQPNLRCYDQFLLKLTFMV